MDHYQYLLLMGGCLAATLPLEIVFGARVWRRPLRLAKAILPVAAVFSAWDVAAVAHHHWSYNPRFVTGWQLPGHLPVEEVVFFVVVPICSLLTFDTVSLLLAGERRGLLGRLAAARRRGSTERGQA